MGLTLEFYIPRKGGKGWWKVNPIQLSRSNKRFNLRRVFNLFAIRLEYPFSEFGKKRQEKLMWKRWIEVDEEVVVSLMNEKRKEEKIKAAVES